LTIDRNALAENYAGKIDDELLRLHSAGTLTDVAYEALEAELARRSVPIPKRPEAPVAPKGRPQSLGAHWRGKASLASAYWLIGALGGLLFSMLANMLSATPIVLLVFLAWIPYSVFALVSIWRCAWNTNWNGWGYLARASVLLNGVYVLAVLVGVLGYLF